MSNFTFESNESSANIIIQKAVTEVKKENKPVIPHLYSSIQDFHSSDFEFHQEYMPYANITFTPQELQSFSLYKISKYQLMKKLVEIDVFFEFREFGYVPVTLERRKELCEEVVKSDDSICYFCKKGNTDDVMYLYTFTEVKDIKKNQTTYILLENKEELEQDFDLNSVLTEEQKKLQKNEIFEFLSI